MSNPLELKSKEQFAGELLRTIFNNSDVTDVAPGSTNATLVEAIATLDFQIQMSILKILEASNIESLTGVNLDKKAISIGVPNGIGGSGRSPSSQAGGTVIIGSPFKKISSKSYAGKPAPFAGVRRLYLEDASSFPATGSIYIGRGTPDRFEGPIAYTSVTNNGSFWVMELSSPLTKSHPHTDLIVLSQGGDRVIPAGTVVLVPANSNSPAVTYTTNAALTIPDGESEGQVQVTCTQFGPVGNALAGAIKEFSGEPFPGATVRNPTSFQNGRPTESDEELRRRIKNYPSTLSRGTRNAILAALQGARDPETGRAITSVAIVEPVDPGEPAKVYIDDGTGLEPSFKSQPYELLLKSASGQETKFTTAQVPITAAVAIGSESGPFILQNNQELEITLDGVSERYRVTGANYRNLNSASAYEVVRDFNSQSNLIGFRTINGGNGIAAFDLSGKGEILKVSPGDLQVIFGLPTAELRPIFLYKNSNILSFRGRTATLTTAPFPWTFNLPAGDLDNVRVRIDGVISEFSVTDQDFAEFGTIVSSATLSQWATVLSRKMSGVKFSIVGNRLVWSTYQTFSENGSLEILTTKANGAPATWIGPGKMWEDPDSGGILSDVGSSEDFRLNRFTGQIELLQKPDPGDTIEIGSRNTRAQLNSFRATSGLFSLAPLVPGPGNSKLVVGFDGEFSIRSVFIGASTNFTPSFPDPVGAYNVVRLFSNEKTLFEAARVGDYLYLVKDTNIVPGWGSKIEGLYIIKRRGINGHPTNQVYTNVTASVKNGSDIVTVHHPAHGFQTGASITVVDAGTIGGINLSATNVTITVVDSGSYTYQVPSAALSDDTGTLDTVTYNADTWIEIEVSSDQRPDWAAIDGVTQNLRVGMVHIFRSTVVPQIVDFGNVSAVTVDQVVSLINSQIAGGTASKIDPQSFLIRSNDYESGTAAIFAVIGNAESMISPGIAGSIQAHVAYSASAYTAAGFPVALVSNQTSQEDGYGTRAYLSVDKDLTDVISTATNPVVQSSPGVTDYPIGFQEIWLTGRYLNYTGRVYNNSPTAPFVGFLRGTQTVRPPQTADARQTSTVGNLDRYAHYGLRLRDLPFTEHDRLVVEMDLDPTDKTVVVPMAKRALIQDIDTLTGSGPGQVISFRLKDPDDLDAFNNPREFFDNQSIYKNFDFSDFKLLTKSVGVYIDSTGANLPARGSLTAIPAKVGQYIEDGDTFTLDDGTNPATVFEFDSDSSVGAGNVAVPFVPGVAATGSLTAISAIPGATIEDGDTFTLDDGVNPPTTFEFDGDSNYILGNVPVPFVAGVQATGTLTAIAAAIGVGIEDGDTFTLDDGINPATVFEFDTDGNVTPGNVAVPIGASDSATLVKAAMIAAINGVGAALLITASAGPGNDINLQNDNYGVAGNVAITESISNGASLNPVGMSGGVNNPTASDIKAAMISAINGVGAGLLITAVSGAGDQIDLKNDDTGTQGNVAIIQNISNGATLTPVGMSGGIDDPTASDIKAAMISAINGVGAGLLITAFSGAGNLINLTNDNPGTSGNVAITESISNGQSLNPIGMSGATTVSYGDKALVLRSTAFNSPTQLRLSIRYASNPDQAEIFVTHTNDYLGDRSRTTILVSLPSGGTIAGSTYNNGSYTVHTFKSGNIARLRFEAAGLNPGSQYVPGNILRVGGSGDLAGTYKIIYAEVGAVEVLAPGIVGYTSPSIFAADENPLSSFPLIPQTLVDIATAINEYSPENPIATAEAIGTNLESYYVTNPTYITSEQASLPPQPTMLAAFSHHSFSCKYSGSAGIWQYDSSNPLLNNIKATVQTVDSIFPNSSDVGATSYSPVDEEVMIVPSNTKTLERWANFAAVSSLPVLANIESIRGLDSLQISSKEDGAIGAVRVSGVTANRLDSFVIGNATNEDNSTRLKLLYSEARTLVRDQLVKVENSVASEIRRAYRTTPVGDSITQANPENTANYFRDTNSVKYIRLSANTARIIFYRNGMGPSQVEPLNPGVGNTVTFTDLGAGLVRVQTNVSAGVLSARVGDMMYVRDHGSTPFPSDIVCKDLDADGATNATSPEYWGYPVVHVTNERDITILAPNITSFGSYDLNSDTDLVFVPAVWNEKNIRTNRAEGAKFEDTVNGGVAYVIVKKLGGGMLSIWLQNSSAEATDDMRLDQMSVSTDDYVVLGEGFSNSNRGTFRLVAHNGRNHLIVYHPGGVDETLDLTTFDGGGVGSRKWAVGPLTAARPIRIIDAESVRIGDRLRISSPLTTSQWFPNTMIGTHEIIGIGYIGRDYTGYPLPHGPSDGVKDNSKFCQYVDIFLPDAPEYIADQNGDPVDAFVLAGNSAAIGFVEKDPFFGFRQVSGITVNAQNNEESDVFLVPKLRTSKMTDIFGTKISAMYKMGYEERTFVGIDGYKVYGGLIQQAHKIVDGSPTNAVVFGGVRAAGARIENLTPLFKAVGVTLTVRPRDGVTLNAIADVIRSTVAGYINNLGVGQPVVLSEMVRLVQGLPGVFSVTITATMPAAVDDRISVSDNEKALVIDAQRDIVIG